MSHPFAYCVFLRSTSHVIRSRFQSLLCQESLSFQRYPSRRYRVLYASHRKLSVTFLDRSGSAEGTRILAVRGTLITRNQPSHFEDRYDTSVLIHGTSIDWQ